MTRNFLRGTEDIPAKPMKIRILEATLLLGKMRLHATQLIDHVQVHMAVIALS